MSKTILISANTCWYLFNFRKNTIKEFINKGFEVYVVAPKDRYEEKLIGLGAKFININIDQGGTNPITDFKTFLSFFKILLKLKPRIAFLFTPKNNIYCGLAARIIGVPYVSNIAGVGGVLRTSSILSKIQKILYRLSQSSAKKIFFQNDDDRNLFKEKNIIVNVPNERIPGSGVDLERFYFDSGFKESEIVSFVFLGRFLEDKGVRLYYEAAKKITEDGSKRAKFYLLGFSDVNNPKSVSREEVLKWENSGAIKYLGESDKVEEVLCKVSSVVLPSFYGEGVPKSLIEAAAMGKIVVTTNSVGCRDIVIDGQTGFLCEPKDLNSLVGAIEKVINLSEHDVTHMRKEARKFVERKFDEKAVIKKYLEELN